MTCIIAIETATEACSAALLIQNNRGQTTVFKRFKLAPREHTKLILPMLDEILEEAKLTLNDVDAIAFGRGPGAFTGLRIATGITQGLALSIDKRTIPISSLAAMASAAQKESLLNTDFSIIAAIDARMGEVYWAEYEVNEGELALIGEEQLSQPSIIVKKTKTLAQKQSVVLIGSAWDVYLEALQNQNPDITALRHLPNKFPDAQEIAELALLAFEKGELKSIEEAQPVYLRNNVAEKSKK